MYYFDRLNEQQTERYLFLGKKSLTSTIWEDSDMKDLFELNSLVYNVSKVDTGCSSCRRTEVEAIRRAYAELLTIKQLM